MKYKIEIDNVLLENEVIEDVEINLLQQVDSNFVNNKNRIEIYIRGNIYSKDNESMKNKEIIQNIIDLKDKYFDVNISIDELKYSFPKLYIYKFMQKFVKGSGNYTLVLLQKFIGDEKELNIGGSDENINK